MKRFTLFFLFAALITAAAYSQYNDDDYEDTPIFQIDDYNMNEKGDQQIRVALEGDFALSPRNLGWGGNASLGYNRFLSPLFSVGANVDFNYYKTKGSNIFYNVPFLAKGTLHLNLGRFEFPLSIAAGFSMQSYLSKFYFGPFIKPEIGAFYRYSPDWSLGITVGASVMPQIYVSNSSQNRTATALDAGLSVRYHF